MRVSQLVFISSMLFLMFSCSGNGPFLVPEPGGGIIARKAYVRLETGDNSTRAQEPSLVGSTSTVSSAVVYFLNTLADPQIVNLVTAGEGSDISIADLEEGIVIDNIGQNITQVMVIGNYNSSDATGDAADFPMQPGMRLSSINSTIMDIEQVNYPAVGLSGLENISTILAGRAPVQEYSVDPTGWLGGTGPVEGDLYAQISLEPLVSRLEISGISYTGSAVSFILDGIYINRFYPRLPFSLDTEGYAGVDNGSDRGKYLYGSPTFAYTGYSTMYDHTGSLINVSAEGTATVSPPTGNIFAYQIFGNTPSPQIVLKLTDIVFRDGTRMDEGYITYSNFIDNGQNPVLTFLPGRIYSIGQLNINDENLKPGPEALDIDVLVTIRDWRYVGIGSVL